MEKKGQLDNSKEFLKLFPNEAHLHFRDMNLRKKVQDLEKSFNYNFVLPETKLELFKSLKSITSVKSRLVRKESSLTIYEYSLVRLDRKIMKADKEISNYLNSANFVDVGKVEMILLSLPCDLLKKLLLDVINKTGIFLNDKDPDSYSILDLVNLRQELQVKYYQLYKSFNLKERRHIKNSLQNLKKIKLGPGNEREMRNYQKRIFELRDIILKH